MMFDAGAPVVVTSYVLLPALEVQVECTVLTLTRHACAEMWFGYELAVSGLARIRESESAPWRAFTPTARRLRALGYQLRARPPRAEVKPGA